ncbi:phage major capsid protein [Lysobacter sp. Root96]|uniref:phage major capsid protein n=1 Tax=Lysobacter sp. Root96 TaxID=1736612 RepID=UPI0006F60392|nr:phage major capsid protein [Lysobacter sp. Root96]KRD71439.1 hypothetical protein ASE45_06415 [Lysobacter sp. Root96]
MKLNRAYSCLEIRAVDEEKRQITGIATTPSPDRYDDVVDPEGAQYKLPIPFLWQHDHRQPIGHVTAAKVSAKEIEVTVQLMEISEPGNLKDRLDEAWQSIKAGLVRGLSIGFKPIESANIEGTWGRRFLSWDWLELSAVTVPANADATIQTIKSIDQKQLAALGTKAVEVVRLEPTPGASGKTKSIKPKPPEGNKMRTIKEQITDFTTKQDDNLTRMNAITAKAADEGRSLDASEEEEFDNLQAENETISKHLPRLRSLETANIAKAKGLETANTNTSAGAAVARDPAVVKTSEKLQPGILFARHAMCVFASKGNLHQAAQLAHTHYGENSPVTRSLKYADGRSMESIIKATVVAGTTQDATWAKPLVEYVNYAGDFVEFLRGRTLIGQFGQGSIPALRRIPFNVHIKGQTVGGTGYWVGEGKPKPVTAFGYNDVYHGWFKVAAISVLTDELIRFSDPSAENLVRDSLAEVLVERMDTDFILPSFAGTANVSPASITNGATAIPSTGTTADDVRADLVALWGPSIAAKNPLRSAVYIMSPNRALRLSMMRNALGQPEFPGLGVNGGTLEGVPVLVSDYVPDSIVVLVNTSDIYYSDDGQATVDFSREASIQMLDNPTNDSGVGTATTLVSMFQTDSTALRAHRFVNWSRRRATAVTYLTGVEWGDAASSS